MEEQKMGEFLICPKRTQKKSHPAVTGQPKEKS